MTSQPYTRDDKDKARANGSRRKQRETEVLRIITDYKNGHAASHCMAEIIKAFERK